jgi:hypothetical protein
MLMECVGEEVEKMEETWKDVGRMNEGFGGWLKGIVGDDGLQAGERSLKVSIRKSQGAALKQAAN